MSRANSNGTITKEGLIVTLVDDIFNIGSNENEINVPLEQLDREVRYKVSMTGHFGATVIAPQLRVGEIMRFILDEGYRGGKIYAQKIKDLE